jgi:hypothetical protein
MIAFAGSEYHRETASPSRTLRNSIAPYHNGALQSAPLHALNAVISASTTNMCVR